MISESAVLIITVGMVVDKLPGGLLSPGTSLALDIYFFASHGYPDAAAVGRSGRSYSRAEYTGLLQAAGFGGLTFYYPYPDHKFPSVIYSDEWLPQKGELAEGRSNYDRDRVACFNERVMFDSLLEEGVFQTFSNSFLIEAVQDG